MVLRAQAGKVSAVQFQFSGCRTEGSGASGLGFRVFRLLVLVASVVPGSTGLVADPTQRSEQVVVVGPHLPP